MKLHADIFFVLKQLVNRNNKKKAIGTMGNEQNSQMHVSEQLNFNYRFVKSQQHRIVFK